MENQTAELRDQLANACSILRVCQFTLEEVEGDDFLLSSVYQTLQPALKFLECAIDVEPDVRPDGYTTARDMLYRCQALFHVALKAMNKDLEPDPGYLAECLAVLRETIEGASGQIKSKTKKAKQQLPPKLEVVRE